LFSVSNGEIGVGSGAPDSGSPDACDASSTFGVDGRQGKSGCCITKVDDRASSDSGGVDIGPAVGEASINFRG
jgi:hypothetical protein